MSSVSFSTERFVEFGKDWSIESELQGRPGRRLESNAWPAGYIRSTARIERQPILGLKVKPSALTHAPPKKTPVL
ncbi:hypothetical protein PGT21_012523 [Puccinia graminis f. sp. tritici]|uniref:Uncharacterized protein n=1 Tax=Puccinia graminis f. sp. tritici TaxID=56615 RepID=A0A5B0P8N3_PUCGR|nr:hypothetical protein PGT21_012523 [Puccinia graminis f. sp. tritici]